MSAPIRAKLEAAGLLEAWSSGLTEGARRGERAAYSFVMGSCAELLAAFDIPLFLPEINCLQTAVQGTAQHFLERAEEHGFSPDVCNYLRADIGMHLAGRELPGRQLPLPCLAIASTACNTYVKWGEVWERLYGMPLFVFDIPGSRMPGRPSRPGERSFDADLAYVTSQLRSLITLCERITGRPLDLQRLSQTLRQSNRMNRDFRRILEFNRNGAVCFDALRQGAAYLGVYNVCRGTGAGVRFFSRAVEELQQVAASPRTDSVAPPPYRLLFAGVPCYPRYSEFIRMFSSRGGLFVASSYLQFASGGGNLDFQYDPERPVESLAEGLLISTGEAMESMFLAGERLLEMQVDYGADGIVLHAVKSCRTVSSGLNDARLYLLSRSSVPVLLIESDMMDRRLISIAQMQNRIDAFFETLALRRSGGGV